MEYEQSQQLLISDIKEYEPHNSKDGSNSWSRPHANGASWQLLIASFCALALSLMCNVILLLSIVRSSETYVSMEELPSAYGMPSLTSEPHNSR